LASHPNGLTTSPPLVYKGHDKAVTGRETYVKVNAEVKEKRCIDLKVGLVEGLMWAMR